MQGKIERSDNPLTWLEIAERGLAWEYDDGRVFIPFLVEACREDEYMALFVEDDRAILMTKVTGGEYPSGKGAIKKVSMVLTVNNL